MVKNSMSKKALISGGTGFIGSHVAEALLKNHWKVHVIDKYGFKEYKDLDSLRNHKNIIFQDIVIIKKNFFLFYIYIRYIYRYI